MDKALFEQKTVVPVVVIDDVAQALPLAKAIANAGGKAIEITLRTPAGLDAIAAIASSDIDIIVGAGTVLSRTSLDDAIKAGSQFLVSPGLSRDLVECAQAQNVAMIPGVATPTEVQAAMALGLSTVKFFPAELSGGSKMLKTFASVYPQLRFMPTGGINTGNLAEYAALRNVSAIGGSWMCPQETLASGDMTAVEQWMREALHILDANQ